MSVQRLANPFAIDRQWYKPGSIHAEGARPIQRSAGNENLMPGANQTRRDTAPEPTIATQ
jgi:hypothetical protein